MNIPDTLKGLGLNEKEAAVYTAALELGTASASAIAKKAGIQRTHFYDLAEKLTDAGLLQVSKGKKRSFSPASPDVLVELQEERLQKLKEVLPEFKAIYNTSAQKPRISFYEGKAGLDQINDDTLRYKNEILAFTTPRFISSRTRSTGSEYIKKRVALGIRARVIGENAAEILEHQKNDRNELRETRILSTDVYKSNVEIGIYGNKVYIIDYKEQFGFIIEGVEIANVMKMIFEMVWKRWER